MKKIRTLIAHNDINLTNDILEAIGNLEYVEIVGTADNGKDTYNKIIDLKPDIVFTEYNMKQMNSLDILKSSKEKLENNIPVFNFISDKNVSDEDLKEAVQIIGKKMNTLITESINDRVLYVLKEYNEYKNL